MANPNNATHQFFQLDGSREACRDPRAENVADLIPSDELRDWSMLDWTEWGRVQQVGNLPAKFLLEKLCSYAAVNAGLLDVRRERLIAEMGCGKNTFTRALARLVDLGLVTVYRPTNHRISIQIEPLTCHQRGDSLSPERGQPVTREGNPTSRTDSLTDCSTRERAKNRGGVKDAPAKAAAASIRCASPGPDSLSERPKKRRGRRAPSGAGNQGGPVVIDQAGGAVEAGDFDQDRERIETCQRARAIAPGSHSCTCGTCDDDQAWIEYHTGNWREGAN